MQKATDEQVIAAYKAGGSVWQAGQLLGMCGQSVHERLVRLGLSKPPNLFTHAEDGRLLREYCTHADAGTLDWLAKSMGRTKPFLARQARRLGLTDANRKKPYLAPITQRTMKEFLANNPHPRGMLGKKHSEGTKDRISDQSSKRWHGLSKAAQIAIFSKSQASWKSGWRTIGGKRKYYRSRWEANYARYLEWLRQRGEIQSWEHEPETFWFEKIRRGTRSYLPDFRVVQGERITYHEVKGWMDPKSRTKLARMAKYHPQIRIILVEKKQYRAISLVVGKMIPGWE